jgi:purine-nucleoside phosphorylase
MNEAMEAAIAAVRARAPLARPRVAVVLGSGWGGLTEQLRDPVRIAYGDLPGFPLATVAGHAGELWLGRIGAVEVAVMSGRRHTYESGDVAGMKLPLRVLQALGCSVLVQTNAAGSLDPAMPPGALMLVSDHINFPQHSPLVGEAGTSRFVGMADAYDPALREGAQVVARARGVVLHEGVYLWCLGPQFETPAEIRAFRMLGADAVGMSTVPETIVARHAGMRVLALSLITNLAAGMAHEQLSHAGTLAQANSSSQSASALLAAIIAAIEP